jgi:hypothetical protein
MVAATCHQAGMVPRGSEWPDSGVFAQNYEVRYLGVERASARRPLLATDSQDLQQMSFHLFR